MSSTEGDCTTFVVIERGGRLPAHVVGAVASDVLAVSQADGELLGPLVSRVGSTLDRVRGRGVAVRRAYLACNRRVDEAAIAARLMIGSQMMAGMAQGASEGTLTLVGDGSSSPATRLHLLRLAEVLIRGARNRRVTVASSFTGADAPLGDMLRGTSTALH